MDKSDSYCEAHREYHGDCYSVEGENSASFDASALLQSIDAMVWAEAIVETCKKMNWTLSDIDEGLMVGWFANAMFAQELKSDKEPCRDCIILGSVTLRYRCVLCCR
jgi:hypothetical protein